MATGKTKRQGQAEHLLYGEEIDVFGDAGYRGIKKEKIDQQELACRYEAGKIKQRTQLKFDRIRERIEQLKASVRAKVEHPFRVIKRQFGYTRFATADLSKTKLSCIHCCFLQSLKCKTVMTH